MTTQRITTTPTPEERKRGETGRQKCELCERRSLPGIRRGRGRCCFHWYAGLYGDHWGHHAASGLGCAAEVQP